jgi:tetratricopeptide (TPR) repeat protein
MSREAASQLRDAIVPHIYQGGRKGVPAFGRSDLSISVADNWPARIFIVEDDPVMLRMVGDYVEQHNMRAVPASGRQEMVDHFAAAEPDLVVLDLRLGQEDGFDLGAQLWMPYYTVFLARACEIAGQVEEALAHLGDAFRIAERTGERWFAAELHRHKGRLLLRQGHAEVAEELYRKALAIAVEQEAKLWELRAAASLGRLWRDQGHRAEARDLLAAVYDWFSEGFGTPDLKEAKALLDSLGS